MSASSPIALLDDDEDEGDDQDAPHDDCNSHVADAAAPQRASHHNGTQHQRLQDDAIEMFLQVMGSTDRQFARERLVRVGFDVSRAVSTLLMNDEPRPYATTKHPHHPAPEILHREDETHTSEAPKGRIHVGLPLSNKWHTCHAHSLAMGEVFVDPDFPPTRASLDGRREGGTVVGDDGDHVIRCLCGVPASARTVQRDGPNYGRFYLSCGQSRRLRRLDSGNNNGSSQQQPRQQQQQCQFFQWDDRNGTRGATNLNNNSMDGRRDMYARLSWHAFDASQSSALFHSDSQSSPSSPLPSHIRQGSIGNCWFLSALAVVAEKEYLVQQLLPRQERHSHTVATKTGCYQVNLCLDGKWTPVIVDSYLPVLYSSHDDNTTSSKATTKKQKFKGAVVSQGQHASQTVTTIACPVFAAVPDRQLWPALVEKAYAKAHGSYAQLSGGFVAEALSDMTGAPTETIVFGGQSSDLLWARLLSFAQAGFLMGVATCRGGDGLVGNHAYSVLDVVEVHDLLVGAQAKVTDFFKTPATAATTTTSPSRKKFKTDNEMNGAEAISVSSSPSTSCVLDAQDRKTIRLVRIRNPWGTREWKGEWSTSSEQWTTALRKRLGEQSFAKGDGTFFMSFEMITERFHHMDIAKCRKGWKQCSVDGIFRSQGLRSMSSSVQLYLFKAHARGLAYISLVQPKKRANTKSQYWYGDPSILILKRKSPVDMWNVEGSAIHGCTRTCSCELFVDPDFEYCVVPFSHHAHASSDHPNGAPFRVTAYSSSHISMEATSRHLADEYTCVEALHRVLLSVGHKLHYAVASQGLLLCIHGQECLYFVGINGSDDHYLSLRLTVQEQKGLMFLNGTSQDTFDLRPRSQAVLVVVSHTGTQASAATSVSFAYASDTVVANRPLSSSSLDDPRSSSRTACTVCSMRSAIPISLAGDLLAGQVDVGTAQQNKGSDTVETNLWLSQVGSAGR